MTRCLASSLSDGQSLTRRRSVASHAPPVAPLVSTIAVFDGLRKGCAFPLEGAWLFRTVLRHHAMNRSAPLFQEHPLRNDRSHVLIEIPEIFSENAELVLLQKMVFPDRTYTVMPISTEPW